MRKEIEKLRLKTRMSETFAGTKLPYPKQKEFAINQMRALQEEYKTIAGEYLKEFLIEGFEEHDNKMIADAKWKIKSAVRKDGAEFSVGSKYKDANGTAYTIKEMIINPDNGELLAYAEEGGMINLWNVGEVK